MPNVFQINKDAKIYEIKRYGKTRFQAQIRIIERRWKNSWHYDLHSAKAWLNENVSKIEVIL